MFRKIAILIVASTILTSPAMADTADDYLTDGREHLFDGTFTGIRSAYQIFDDGLRDQSCPSCVENNELLFFHALAGICMLIAEDNGADIDSIFELSQAFGLTVIGDNWAPYWIPNTPELDIPTNDRDYYEVPETAPDTNDLADFRDSVISRIDAILYDLNSIQDSPEPFKVYIQPDELRVFFKSDSDIFNPGSGDYDPDSMWLSPVEVDYGEVLILKALMNALKANLQAQAAYDTYLDDQDKILENIYGQTFQINDLLNAHPELLLVLPTSNDPNDGTAALTQSGQNLIDSVNTYLDAVTYIANEDSPPGTDPQDDELLYLDPNSAQTAMTIGDKLIQMRDSLANDTTAAYTHLTTNIYTFQDPQSPSTTWTLELTYDALGNPDAGYFTASDQNSAPSPWEVSDVTIQQDIILIEMDYDLPDYWWGFAFFEADISGDLQTISNGTFTYEGPDYGSIVGFNGSLTDTQIEQAVVDLNPVFGNTARFPAPLNPRDLLPEFDRHNAPLPGTIGAGLGNDPTLAGILPEATQFYWQTEFDLQPGGLFYLDFVDYGQINVDGYLDEWTPNQLVFADLTGDTDNPDANVPGTDIKNLYLAYDWDTLYGAIELADNFDTADKYYDLVLSYSPEKASACDSLKITLWVSTNAWGELYHIQTDEYGWSWWNPIAGFDAERGTNSVEFMIPFEIIPADLPGRFISIQTDGWNCDYSADDGEENDTHLQIGETGTITGTVSYDNYTGDPIYIEAYTDPFEPDESVIARTMIAAPGPYTLEGIGYGWRGYIRAYTPVFGFDNPFELGAFDVETSVRASLQMGAAENVDIDLHYPTLLENDVWHWDNIDVLLGGEKWYTFYAIEGGTYTFEVDNVSGTWYEIELYNRDGSEDLLWANSDYPIDWVCPVGKSGQYFVKIEAFEPFYENAYQIKMTTDITGPMIGTTPSTLKFEVPVGETSIVNFDIFNAGIGTLDWDITDSVLWITSASPDSGSSTGRDDITTVELNIDTLGLACGRYDTTVRISSPQADRFYLPVILGVYDRADFREFAVLANYWQADDCNQYPDCNAIDYYVDGTIDIKDLTMLAEYWLGNVQPREPQITDDFETGDFSKLYWQTNGHQPWQIDGIEACGMYSARSGAIEDGQLSILELTVEVIDYDTISFERKVSSESGWDHLSFYIDGELQDRWSGEQDWNTVSFPITDGTHTLKWQYSKDPDCCSSGSDCAWIDNLTIYNATPIPE